MKSTLTLALALAATLGAASPARAVVIGTLHYQLTSNGIDSCMYGTFDDVENDVFGTPVNLNDAGAMFCSLHNDGVTTTSSCASTPNAGLISFSVTGGGNASPTLPTPGVPQSFVGTIGTFSGSLLAGIPNLTLMFDGTLVFDGTFSPVTLPGCSLAGTLPNFHGQFGVNGFQAEPTGTGSNVQLSTSASYVDQATGEPRAVAVDIAFDVTGSGATTVVAASSSPGVVTPDFQVDFGGLVPIFLDITTTATISGPIQVCQSYTDDDNDEIVDGTTVNASSLRILHGEGDPVTFVDRTILPVNTALKKVCGSVTSLSPFVVAVALSTHDSVVLPLAPVKVKLKDGATSVSRTIPLKVINADADAHTIQLAVTSSTCPMSLLMDGLTASLVDFDKATGFQNSVAVPAGKSRMGKLKLNVQAADFTTTNAKSPARCTLTLTASAVTDDAVTDPNPSNDQIVVDLEVVDMNDVP